jgi:hypothetical protein
LLNAKGAGCTEGVCATRSRLSWPYFPFCGEFFFYHRKQQKCSNSQINDFFLSVNPVLTHSLIPSLVNSVKFAIDSNHLAIDSKQSQNFFEKIPE